MAKKKPKRRRKPSPKPKTPPRATKTQVELRVAEILAIRLDGAEFWDCREFVRERESARENEANAPSPWLLADGAKPLSDGQIRRYITQSDSLIAASCRAQGKKLLQLHLAQRRNMYSKAMAQGDVRAALACKRDEAQLLDLYPAQKVKAEVAGKDGAPLINIDTMVAACIKAEELAHARRGPDPGATDAPAGGAPLPD